MQGNRKTIRLKNYDYSQEGAYFVTICVKNRQCLLGKIINNKMALNNIGETVEFTWLDLPNHNKNIELDHFVIMPNHIHGIINIVGAGSQPALNQNNISINNIPDNCKILIDHKIKRAGLEPAPTCDHGLSEIIRQFKTFSARRVNKINNISNNGLWQRNFYERIIRDQHDLNRIYEYIDNNPVNWESDENNIKNKNP